MLENKRAGLLSMAGRAALVQAGHCQASSRFHYVVTVRIVTLDAAHPILDYRVVLWQ
jgi:hypothetical protein